MSNFSTCKFRSEEEEELFEKACCGMKKKTGYICWRLQIEGLTEKNCENCEFYTSLPENKKTGNENDPF